LVNPIMMASTDMYGIPVFVKNLLATVVFPDLEVPLKI